MNCTGEFVSVDIQHVIQKTDTGRVSVLKDNRDEVMGC
jgi:hypothetical protein